MRSPKAAGQLVNVGNDNEEIEIGSLVRLLFEITGYDAEIDEHPAPPGSVDRRCPDLSRLREIIGDRPLTSLRDGLAATAAWYRDRTRTRA
jgi:UDP-glucose 4-epimerase/UDP-glucuronate decarboxylase